MNCHFFTWPKNFKIFVRYYQSLLYSIFIHLVLIQFWLHHFWYFHTQITYSLLIELNSIIWISVSSHIKLSIPCNKACFYNHFASFDKHLCIVIHLLITINFSNICLYYPSIFLTLVNSSISFFGHFCTTLLLKCHIFYVIWTNTPNYSEFQPTVKHYQCVNVDTCIHIFPNQLV